MEIDEKFMEPAEAFAKAVEAVQSGVGEVELVWENEAWNTRLTVIVRKEPFDKVAHYTRNVSPDAHRPGIDP